MSPSKLPLSVDVVVIGCGITGSATAAALAERSASVLVIDKESGPAREGSGRAQGSLRVQGRHPAEFPLAVEAMQLWARAAAEDPEHDLELRTGGNLYFATAPDERPMLESLAAQARSSGLDQVRYLEADAVRQIVPAASGPFLGAMWSPYDAQAQPELATELFVRRAARLGARFAFGIKAIRIVQDGRGVSGVATTAGTISTRAVVAATGIWTAHLLAGVGVRVPLMPVALTELETAPLPELFRPSVRAFGFGARQRPDGRLVVSAGLGAVVTRRASLFDLRGLRYWLPRAAALRKNLRIRVDAAQVLRELRHRSALTTAVVPDRSREPLCDKRSVDAALRRLGMVFPAASRVTAARYWAGMVDMTPDGLPVIDQVGPQGLAVVTGLCGHGLAIGPVLGEIAADLTLDGASRRPLNAFSLARFEGRVGSPEVMI